MHAQLHRLHACFDNFNIAWTRTIDKDSYQLLCCRGSTIAMSHSSDYLRLHCSSPAIHQRRCSFVANLRPRDHVSHVLRDLHAPNPRANIIHIMCNIVNYADIHDGMVMRISDLPSVSSPFCRGGIRRASHSDCVWFQGFFNRWPMAWNGYLFTLESFGTLFQISTQNSFYSNSISYLLPSTMLIFVDYFCLMYI